MLAADKRLVWCLQLASGQLQLISCSAEKQVQPLSSLHACPCAGPGALQIASQDQSETTAGLTWPTWLSLSCSAGSVLDPQTTWPVG